MSKSDTKEVNYTWEAGYLIVEWWGDIGRESHGVYLDYDEAKEEARRIEADTDSDVHLEYVDVQIPQNDLITQE